MGNWLTKYGQSIYGTRGGPIPTAPGRRTWKNNLIYLHVFQWEGNQVKLPALSRKIVGSSVLTGGSANVSQSDEGVLVSVPADQQDKIDTIIKLELDGPAG